MQKGDLGRLAKHRDQITHSAGTHLGIKVDPFVGPEVLRHFVGELDGLLVHIGPTLADTNTKPVPERCDHVIGCHMWLAVVFPFGFIHDKDIKVLVVLVIWRTCASSKKAIQSVEHGACTVQLACAVGLSNCR